MNSDSDVYPSPSSSTQNESMNQPSHTTPTPSTDGSQAITDN
jgi:hypothetical protein